MQLFRRQTNDAPLAKGGAAVPALNWLLLLALLAGVFFRWSALQPMNDMLHYDEAYNGMDALSLLRHPRLTPFFPGNFGREAGWIYLLVPFVAVFGTQALGLRLAATIVGVLTIAVTYRLERRCCRGGRRPGQPRSWRSFTGPCTSIIWLYGPISCLWLVPWPLCLSSAHGERTRWHPGWLLGR